MILKKAAFSSFARKVKAEGKQVVVYGAGVIGETVAPYWLHEYGLDRDVLCYVDTDDHKQGKMIQIGSRAVPVMPLTALERPCGDCVILITVSAFASVVQLLERLPEAENMEIYFLPLMLLDAAHALKQGGVVKTGDQALIPKKIHYCWFSRSPIPDRIQECMNTWKRFCPDYEIVRWDESNYDIGKSTYMKQAYAHRKWSFVSDFARLDILYRHGGIYLDTDVEMLRSPDALLYQPGFCGVEKWGFVNTGAGIGAYPGNPIVKAMLDFRKRAVFVRDDGTLNLTTCGYYETLPLIALGLKPGGDTQTVGGGKMTVYASEFFQPFDYVSGETHITQNTFSIHHFSGTWLGRGAALAREKTHREFGEFMSRLEE